MIDSTTFDRVQAGAGARSRTDLLAILGAVALGASLLWVAGFANAEGVHAGAHDSRHSITFPCH